MDGKLGSQYIEIGAKIDKLQAGMAEARAEMAGMARSAEASTGRARVAFDALGTAIGVSLAGIAARAVTAVIELTKWTFELGKETEITRARYENFTGSVDRATFLMKGLRALSVDSGLEFAVLDKAGLRLMNAGMSAAKLESTMRTLTATSLSLGQGSQGVDRLALAFSQMAQKGKVSAEEMTQQLGEIIPAWQILADKIGVTVPQAMEMAKKGAIDSSTAIDALLEGLNERFAGGIDKRASTLEGRWSRLMKQLTEDARPFGELLTQLGHKLMDFAENVVKFAKAYHEFFTKDRNPTGQAVAEMNALVTESLKKTADQMKKTAEEAGGYTRSLAGFGGGSSSRGGGKATSVYTATEHVTEAQKTLQQTLKGIESYWDRAIARANTYMDAVGRATLQQWNRDAKEQIDIVRTLADVIAVTPGLKDQLDRNVSEGLANLPMSKGNTAIFNPFPSGKMPQTPINKEFARQVSTVLTDVSRQVTDLIFKGGKLKDVLVGAMESFGKAILRMAIERNLQRLADQLGGLLTKIPMLGRALGAIFGGGGSAAGSVVGAAGSAAGSAAGGVAGGAGSAAGGIVSGAMGAIGAVAAVGTLITGIIGNFQNARQETTLNAIEWNTRKSSIHLEYILTDGVNKWLANLPSIHERLIELVNLGRAGGGGATINVQGGVFVGPGGMGGLLDMLISEARARGLKIA